MKKIIALLTCLFVGSANAGIISLSDIVSKDEIHDHYFSVSASGLVTIDVLETLVDGDGFDSEINLFSDDGSLDLTDFIANNDDYGFSLESHLSLILDAGNYLLRIGTSDFGNSSGTDAVIIGDTNSSGYAELTDYDLNIEGQYVSGATPDGSIPEPSILALLAFGIAGLRVSRKNKSL